MAQTGSDDKFTLTTPAKQANSVPNESGQLLQKLPLSSLTNPDKFAKLIPSRYFCKSCGDNIRLKVLLQQNISEDFAHFLHEKKVLKSLSFTDWVDKATALDADFRRFERPKLDRITLLKSKLVEASKRSGASSHYDNGQARQRPFTPIENTSSRPPSSSSHRLSGNSSCAPTNNPAFGVLSVAKVKEDSRQFDIYMKGEICRKCRNWKAGHVVAERSGDKPVLSVPYRALTLDDLKFVNNFFDKYRKPLTMDEVLARKSAPVAAVAPVTAESPVRDVDSFLNGGSSSAVAALMGGLPIAHI
ncbi:hypothetical protein K435DRAFT_860586 [Dendrothele bispora CBS 962.96]|uniref:Uncharacterized protein n=1 Tax=Dendrothele bispora (strain CBS 962.96) TaxID=1314807 RepID=A0A4S8LXK6_DENBC|nr:hypothetical protein K435DRAFT_860586 [Dendrothele bispora CBS 962.96]